MILISIKESRFDAVKKALKLCDAAEIRLDYCKLNPLEIKQIFSSNKTLIATSRVSDIMSETDCMSLYVAALEGKSKNILVDVDINSSSNHLKEVISKCRERGAKVIISYHNFITTPSEKKLTEIANSIFDLGADLAKISTFAENSEDASKVIQLYKHFSNNKLIAFAMGDSGKFTRKLAYNLGSPFVYTSLDEENTTAPGQFTYKDFVSQTSPQNFKYHIKPKGIKSVVSTTSSKSHAQRAITLASLSNGVTTLKNYTECDDNNAAIELFRNLGVSIKKSEDDLHNKNVVISSGGIEAITDFINKSNLKVIELKVGESGLLSKLITPIAALISTKIDKDIIISGNGSILKRDFSQTCDVLHELNIPFKINNNYLPLIIESNTTGFSKNQISIPGNAGSQIISGSIIASSLIGKEFELSVNNPNSVRYIDMTMNVLEDFNIKIVSKEYSNFKIYENQKLVAPSNIDLEGDWSSASTLLVIGSITSGITVENLKTNSAQSDEAILDVLRTTGVEIYIKENNVKVIPPKGMLQSFEFDATDAPDLFPALVLLAVNCNGTSKIKGVKRLYNKESNRAEALFGEFTKLGADIRLEDDSMIISGDKSLKSNYCSSYNDHRIAMALIGASIKIKEGLKIDNIDCLSKSFPNYLDTFTY